MNRLRNFAVRATRLALPFVVGSVTLAQAVVVPNSLAAAEGNSSETLPFYSTGFMRFQQVYDASQFSAMSGGAFISAMRFRPDSVQGAAFSHSTTIDVWLSTTAFAPDNLSSTFADNVGADETQVFSGSVALSSANTGGVPRDFDVVLTFSTPFLYNPANGNLLWEVKRYSATTTFHYLDAEDTFGDSISMLWNEPNAQAPTGVARTSGLVTKFDFVPVPEPTTAVALALGALALARRRTRT
ncbi:MAG: PEP-CTERM sorting domain-containing protein [Fimbriimonadaceae bacterium]|nr:hypothetical protein [Fimbriimonadaceae bacterium]MCC6351466.1 PEP-CTERM sorting domain-containing protein [Fimbriimonadaceae bacterium]MCL4285829.1 PEP-CTERM sorting domain-containing protein [Fimbriimonadaceae bacterium]QOJ12072.1 MAG: PEP-CTERM sorting domain-containing protein [Chthonomonadaceae bacterium]